PPPAIYLLSLHDALPIFAVGLVDVKNTWVEPPELVAERLRLVLKYVEPGRLHVTPDCGFSQTARAVACQKLKNMVDGVRMVRKEDRKSTRLNSSHLGISY